MQIPLPQRQHTAPQFNGHHIPRGTCVSAPHAGIGDKSKFPQSLSQPRLCINFRYDAPNPDADLIQWHLHTDPSNHSFHSIAQGQRV
jgi:hypothetical protein